MNICSTSVCVCVCVCVCMCAYTIHSNLQNWSSHLTMVSHPTLDATHGQIDVCIYTHATIHTLTPHMQMTARHLQQTERKTTHTHLLMHAHAHAHAHYTRKRTCPRPRTRTHTRMRRRMRTLMLSYLQQVQVACTSLVARAHLQIHMPATLRRIRRPLSGSVAVYQAARRAVEGAHLGACHRVVAQGDQSATWPVQPATTGDLDGV